LIPFFSTQKLSHLGDAVIPRITLIIQILNRCVYKRRIGRRRVANRFDGYAQLKEALDDVWEATKQRKHFDSTSCVIELMAIAVLYLNDLASDDGLSRLEFAYNIEEEDVEHK
jgi:hypothetical protein